MIKVQVQALPLTGVTVLEFSHMVMGPTCGMILADLGAEVIKVEPPSGDKTRQLPGLAIGFFSAFNRNKQHICIDLSQPEGVAAVGRLASKVDVLIENFRPGYMEKLGLDYVSLSAVNPGLVYVSLKGFLPGPYQARTALDEAVQMMGGLAYMTGPPGQPLRAGSSVNDIMGGLFGALGALAALRERDISGKGKEVQAALYENCVFLAAQHMQQFQLSGIRPPPFPSRVHAWGVYDIFHLNQGAQLFIAVTGDTQWLKFCKVLGLPDLVADERLLTNTGRVRHRDFVVPRLQEHLADKRLEDVCRQLEDNAIPFAQIVRPDELLQDPHLLHSGGLDMLTTAEGVQTKVALLPLALDGKRLGVRKAIGKIGEDTHAVLARHGFSIDEIQRLMQQEAIA